MFNFSTLLRFNSMIVRLKALNSPCKIKTIVFQFYDSPIKSIEFIQFAHAFK